MKNAYAGFWRRLLAIGIDFIILWIITGVIIICAIRSTLYILYIFTQKDFIIFMKNELIIASFILLGIVIIWIYFVFFESSSFQATPGKIALGIIVTDLYGRRISFRKANKRHWGKILSLLTITVGFIQAGLSKRKQALHDFFADCLVFKKKMRKEYLSFICIKCKKEAKILKGKGKVHIECPRCHKKYVVKT